MTTLPESVNDFSEGANTIRDIDVTAAILRHAKTRSQAQARVLFMAPELLFVIFGNLTTRELVMCAKACKSWSQIALDTKWRTFPIKLSRLLTQLIPVSEWYKKVPHVAECDQPLNPKNVGPFCERFAHKVTHLIIDMTISPSNTKRLRKLIRGYICPLLKRIDIDDIKNQLNLTNTIALFAGPSLKYARVRQRRPELAKIIIPVVSVLGPFVETLHLTSRVAVFEKVAPAFVKLHTLILDGGFSHRAWMELARCPSLQTITVPAWRNVKGSKAMPHPIPTTTLSTLKTLACQDAIPAPILISTATPHLRELSIAMASMPVEERKRAFAAICRGSPFMETLTVKCDAHDTYDILSDGLKSLWELQSLRIHGNGKWVWLTDENMDDLTQSLPRLLHLDIESNALTQYSLSSLAIHCPFLKTLTTNVHIVPWDVNEEIVIYRQLRLEEVTVRKLVYPEGWLTVCADMLAKAWPAIRKLDVQYITSTVNTAPTTRLTFTQFFSAFQFYESQFV